MKTTTPSPKPTMHIQPELKNLVSMAVKTLGLAIQEVYGEKLYQEVEKLRLKMKSIRGAEAEVVAKGLDQVYAQLKHFSTPDLHRIVKSFSLMLELINTCEASYRSHRLKGLVLAPVKLPYSMVYVFTGHPTEARSGSFLYLMEKIGGLLDRALVEGTEAIHEQLLHLLAISLKMDLANNKRPQVKDEAQQVFQTVLNRRIIEEQINLKKVGVNVLFRTWVGGDKDGHPKVGPSTMVQSLELSRKKISEFFELTLKEYLQDISIMGGERTMHDQVVKLIKALRGLRRLKAGDGKKVSAVKAQFAKLLDRAGANKMSSPGLQGLEQLLWLYPALVMPLEIREDSQLIHAAMRNQRQTIARMLKLLQTLSKGLEAKWYVRGFIISMCQTTEDFLAAAHLTKKMMGELAVPVVPLFENEQGLRSAVEILSEGFAAFPFVKEHQKRWGGRFEVMLGYSDSSKENGVLPGRLLVERALNKLDKLLSSQQLTPVFFHGSGGSVSRGGGSIKEQTAWWPQSALNLYKVTIQGETIQRHFQRPSIMRSQVGKILDGLAGFKPHKVVDSKALNHFAGQIQASYRRLVQDPSFHQLASMATPYDFLSLLKIGSRPTKRAGKGKFTLRAIPWILCWTQTRLLLPVWWGIGEAWQGLDKAQREKIRECYEDSPLMQSYVKNLGFTLAEIELGVWMFHIKHSQLSDVEKASWNKKIIAELDNSIQFFKDITGNQSYTWYRPWLQESITFRSSMIHPLNVIQKISLERREHALLRETVTGIACGMLTTG